MKLFGKKRPALSERSESKGFTLIELMLVVGIIMVLASLVIVSVGKSRARGRDGKRIADLSTIQLAMEMYKDSNNVYPSSYGPWATSIDPVGGYWPNFQGTLAPYLKPIPKDPINNDKYRYWIYSGMDYTTEPDTNNNRYYIRARMEDADNKNAGAWCYYLIGGLATNYYGDGSDAADTDTFCD